MGEGAGKGLMVISELSHPLCDDDNNIKKTAEMPFNSILPPDTVKFDYAAQ